MNIRCATLLDSRSIAELHVRAWGWAYRGLLPDVYLDGMSVDERELSWRKQLDPHHPVNVFAAERDGRVVGFIACGPTADETLPPESGEVFALYRERAEVGIGALLFERARADLHVRGCQRVVLWVLERNIRGRRFYERMGFLADGAVKEERRPGCVLSELRYADRPPDASAP